MGEQLRRLGLLADQEKALSASTLTKLEALAQIDLTLEKRSFVSRHPDERPYVEVLERELKRFLSLPLFVPDPDCPFAPSLRVDELWHDFILNTPKYRLLCNNVYGAYLDHSPNQEELAKDFPLKAGEMAEFTNSMLTKYYGILDQAIWGSEIMRPCYPPPPAPPISAGTSGES